MASASQKNRSVPPWLLRRLPANAADNPDFAAKLETISVDGGMGLTQLTMELNKVRAYCEYDTLANQVCARVWAAKERILSDDNPGLRDQLLDFAKSHMPAEAQSRIFRWLIRDPDPIVRRNARRAIERCRLREVALPATAVAPWDTSGWLRGTTGGRLMRRRAAKPADRQIGLFESAKRLFRHRAGSQVTGDKGLPKIANLLELRQLLGIRSPRQLGYLLLATDKDGGPYTQFIIPKQDGSERSISAPKDSLRWVQRRILRRILDQLPAHSAAHGFIRGRSTATNAAPHCGAELIVKFDLENFFPTIHYYRVMGFFANLGYAIEDAKFGNDDESRQVAATLARLCVHTPDPRAWGTGSLPQGAPSSPAISNLICRGLDAWLTGLATRLGACLYALRR